MTSKTEENAVTEMCDHTYSGDIVCNVANAKGLHLHFKVADDKSVEAVLECDPAFEGYPGILHGGVISTVLDVAMGHCMFVRGRAAVTVEMTTRFRHPVLIGKNAVVSAKLTRPSHPLYLLEAKIVQDGVVRATAKGKFFHQPKLNYVCERVVPCDTLTP